MRLRTVVGSILIFGSAIGCDVLDDLSTDIDLELTWDGAYSNATGGACTADGQTYDETESVPEEAIDAGLEIKSYEITSWTLTQNSVSGTGQVGLAGYGLFKGDGTPIVVATSSECAGTELSLTDVTAANQCLENLRLLLNDDQAALLEAINVDGTLRGMGTVNCSGDFSVDVTIQMAITAKVGTSSDDEEEAPE